MTRPEIIRADTLDLQASDHPSAQDHSQHRPHPSPLGLGPAAVHQQHSLQHVQEERRAEQEHLPDAWGSGRSSHEGSDLLNDEPRMSTESFNHHDSDARLDSATEQQISGRDESEPVEGEEEEEDGDDDIDDKISSSPSISDGVYIYFPSTSADPTAPTNHYHRHQDPELDGITASCSKVGADGCFPNNIYAGAHHGFCFEPDSYKADDSDTIFEPEPRPIFSYGINACLDWDVPDDQECSLLSHIGIATTHLSTDLVQAVDENAEVVQPYCDQDLQRDAYDDIPPPHSRFIDSGFGGESLRDAEDIDFEFVYALHTFVATVEGQANATKGDTMVLLDDTNSYWWLVRIVKDNTIGYLPAEHIETPTERLARLNKHRNIDLSASMLGDNPEKSKNPLKKAMRRRNAKMVQFAPPTFYPPSEVDWSDTDPDRDDGLEEEEIQEGDMNGHAEAEEVTRDSQATLANGHVDPEDEDKITKLSAKDEAKATAGEVGRTESKASSSDAEDSTNDQELDSRAKELTAGRSRNGTIRNTDSFFKDNSAEPKKISLTPNLLREESLDGSGASNESRDKMMQDIFDQIEAETNPGEKSRDRKKKEKKSNMLSGLFKRKDKKIKVDEAVGVAHKTSGDDDSTGSPGDSGRNSPTTPSSPTTIPPTQPLSVRRPSVNGKLTKAPPSGLITSKGSQSSKSSNEKSPISPQQSSDSLLAAATAAAAQPAETNTIPSPMEATRSLAIAMPGGFPISPDPTPQGELQQRLGSPAPSEKQHREGGVLSPLTSLLSTNSSSSEPKRERLKKAKERIELDVDSSPEAESPSYNPFQDPEVSKGNDATTNGSRYGDSKSLGQVVQDLRAVSPVSPIDPSMPATSFPSRSGTSASQTEGPGHANQPMSPVSPPVATDSQGEPTREFGSEPKSSTETSYRSERARADSNMTTASSVTTATPAPATPPPSDPYGWDDRALRTWVNNESHSEVKDLLIIVHDDTGVQPLPQDHPTMIGLGFHQQHKQLNDMSSQLDSLLNGFLARRVASRPRAASNSAMTMTSTVTAAQR